MTKRMSEREKMYFFAILFPVLWPILIALVIEDVCRGIRHIFVSAYTWITRSRQP